MKLKGKQILDHTITEEKLLLSRLSINTTLSGYTLTLNGTAGFMGSVQMMSGLTTNDINIINGNLNLDKTDGINLLDKTDKTLYNTTSSQHHISLVIDGLFHVISGFLSDPIINRINPLTKEIISRTLTYTNSLAAGFYLNDYIYAAGNGGIVKIHKDTLIDTVLLSSTNFGILPGLTTDGTYIYVGSYALNGQTGYGILYKYTLSGVYVNSINIGQQLHWCGYHAPSNSLLVTDSVSSLYKINTNTFTLTNTFTNALFTNCVPTDDQAIQGNYVWVGYENSNSIVKVNINDFNDYTIIDCGHQTYCIYYDGNETIYNGSKNSSFITTININDLSIIQYNTNDTARPNEILVSGDYILNTRWGQQGIYVRKKFITPLLNWENGDGKFDNIYANNINGIVIPIEGYVPYNVYNTNNTNIENNNLWKLENYQHSAFYRGDTNILVFEYTSIDVSIFQGLVRIKNIVTGEYFDTTPTVSVGDSQVFLDFTLYGVDPTGESFLSDELNIQVYILYRDSIIVKNNKNVIANSFIPNGGTPTDFLKGDGSLDPTKYIDEMTAIAYAVVL